MKNIYILAMEYGNKHQQGFLYPSMKAWIEEQMGISLNQDMEVGLVSWFVNSFSAVSLELSESQKDNIIYTFRYNQTTEGLRIRFEKSTWIINGLTTKQFVDYLELKESRQQAIRAFYTSIASIIIALGSIGLSFYFFKTAPKPASPPYEVKIIEDGPRQGELERKIDSLINEINKAKLPGDAAAWSYK